MRRLHRFLLILAVSAATQSAEARSDSFAVDQVAYVSRAKTVLSHLLENREFYTDSFATPEDQNRARKLLRQLRRNEFEIVPPFEWSDNNPNLPSYVEFRTRCPNFDFEFDTVDGTPVTATERFGLYELPAEFSLSDEDRLFAFRAERFVYSNGQIGWPGSVVFFRVEGCWIINGELIARPVNTSPGSVFNEIVKIADRFFVVRLSPVLPGSSDAHLLAVILLGDRASRTRVHYQYSTIKP